jgi:hypothetical protein
MKLTLTIGRAEVEAAVKMWVRTQFSDKEPDMVQFVDGGVQTVHVTLKDKEPFKITTSNNHIDMRDVPLRSNY